MRLRPLFFAVALSLAPALAPATSSAEAARWERLDESDGITVFRQEVPGSPVIAFKGIGVVNAPLGRVAAAVIDAPRTVEWMDRMAEARVLRRVGPLEQIIYSHLKTPTPLTDRDFVTDARVEIDPANKRVIVHIRSVTDPAAPHTSYVRGEIHHSSFSLTSIEGGKRTLVVTEIHADPKGSVPTFIVNMFQKDWPHNTIRNLRAQAVKPNVQLSPEIAEKIAGF